MKTKHCIANWSSLIVFIIFFLGKNYFMNLVEPFTRTLSITLLVILPVILYFCIYYFILFIYLNKIKTYRKR